MALVVDAEAWAGTGRAHPDEPGWRVLEPVLRHQLGLTRPVIASLQRYYQKGQLPDFRKVHLGERTDETSKRHLNLFFFLCLYPSQDEATLVRLRENYLSASEIRSADIAAGYDCLYRVGVELPFVDGKLLVADKTGPRVKHIEVQLGLEQDLTRVMQVMYDAVDDTQVRRPGSADVVPVTSPSFGSLLAAGNWLQHRAQGPVGESCLLQHPRSLEILYRVAMTEQRQILADLSWRAEGIEQSLYRIASFEKRGRNRKDPARLAFVRGVARLFEVHDWFPELATLWAKVNDPAYRPATIR